ncbi:hypothetical protein ABID20_004526 [Rhizobium alvei]
MMDSYLFRSCFDDIAMLTEIRAAYAKALARREAGQ